MLGVQDFWVFLAAGITLNIMPGPDTMYIIGRSLAQGRKAGVVSVFGISSGGVCHTTAVAFGLSAILVSLPWAFTILKWTGALYLMYLGVQMLRPVSSVTNDEASEPAHAALWTIYRQGLLTNVLNPKVALFFMAFLPQFVAADRASSPLPFLFLGSVFICTGTLWCLLIAVLAATVSQALRKSSKSLTIARCVTGLVFVSLGVRLALQQL